MHHGYIRHLFSFGHVRPNGYPNQSFNRQSGLQQENPRVCVCVFVCLFVCLFVCVCVVLGFRFFS